MASTINKLYERRNSNKMSSLKPQPPAQIAYRDESGQVQYVKATNPNQTYDSDGEPLITNPDEDATQRFTATGQPIQPARLGALQAWGGDMYALPKLLPKQYTDDSIIPAIVTGVIPRAKVEASEPTEGTGKRRKSFAKLFGKGDKEKKDDGKGITKVVFMPRREYQKYFAKDNDGNYIGSEPAKQWTEEELDEKFAQYRPEPGKSKGEALGFFSAGVLNNNNRTG